MLLLPRREPSSSPSGGGEAGKTLGAPRGGGIPTSDRTAAKIKDLSWMFLILFVGLGMRGAL